MPPAAAMSYPGKAQLEPLVLANCFAEDIQEKLNCFFPPLVMAELQFQVFLGKLKAG